MPDQLPTADEDALIRRLPIFTAPVAIAVVAGGITNRNFLISGEDGRFIVRFGEDIPVHGVMRFNELAAAKAAHEAGLSPEVVYAAPGIMVTRCLAGRSLEPEDVRRPDNLSRIVDLVRRCHRDVPAFHRGPVLAFWVFQVIRSYLATLGSEPCRIAERLPRLAKQAAELEALVGPVTIVFGHNDLLAANLFDDGDRLWLLDWDYAGLNSPLFDLANLSSNNALSEDEDRFLLSRYFGGEPDASRLRAFTAMKCASLMREALWSAVSETRSRIVFDYPAYTDDYLLRLDAALDRSAAILGAGPRGEARSRGEERA